MKLFIDERLTGLFARQTPVELAPQTLRNQLVELILLDI